MSEQFTMPVHSARIKTKNVNIWTGLTDSPPEKSSKEPGDDIEQLPVDKIALVLPGFVMLAGMVYICVFNSMEISVFLVFSF